MSYKSCTCTDTRSVSLPYMGKYFLSTHRMDTCMEWLCTARVRVIVQVYILAGRERGGDGVIELITRGSSPISPRETTLSIPGSKHPLPIIPPGFLKLNLRTSNPTHVCAIYPSVRFFQWSVLNFPDSWFYILPWFSLSGSCPYCLKGRKILRPLLYCSWLPLPWVTRRLNVGLTFTNDVTS